MSRTPGPWTDGGDPTGDIYGTWDDDEYHEPIIECDSGVYGPYGDDRKLILAAPDLADVAHMVLNMATVYTPPELVQAATEALRKAGEIPGEGT